MSQSVTAPINGEQAVTGALRMYAGPAGTPMPVIDVPVINCGVQSLIYGASANAGAVTAAVQAGTAETGLGKDASLTVTIPQQGSSTWVAWVAVSDGTSDPEFDSVPTSNLAATFTKGAATVTVGTRVYNVYSAAGTASETSASVQLTFGGDQVWQSIGYTDQCDLDEAGVTVAHEQSLTAIRCGGSPGVTKYVRDTEDLTVSFAVQDLTLPAYNLAMDKIGVLESANTGGVGWKSIDLERPSQPATYAIVGRGQGMSPYVEDHQGHIQYWIPWCVQAGSPQPVFTRGSAAMLAFEFKAMEDRTPGRAGRYGRYVAQDRLRNAA